MKNEGLIRDPKEAVEGHLLIFRRVIFFQIFKKIDLDFDDRVKRKLQEFSGVQNPNDTTDIKIPLSSRKSIKRNSRSNIWNWKKRLDVEQIEYIRNRVEPLSSHFYNDNDW